MTEVVHQQTDRSEDKGFTRRDFLKKGGAAVALSTAGLVIGPRVFAKSSDEPAAATGVKYAMVIDLDRC